MSFSSSLFASFTYIFLTQQHHRPCSLVDEKAGEGWWTLLESVRALTTLGVHLRPGPAGDCDPAVFAGATSAPCLIFIFPAIFYFRIMPTEKEPARSTPKILVGGVWKPVGWGGVKATVLSWFFHSSLILNRPFVLLRLASC